MAMEEEKRQFAKLIIDGLDENKAAFTIFPKDPANRMKASIQWSKDSEVLAFTKEILGISAPEKTLPTKEEHISELYGIFRDGEVGVRERLVASEQISKMQGFISDAKEKNTTVNNKIMIVTRSATDDDWEKAIQAQQNKLVAEVLVDVKDVTDED